MLILHLIPIPADEPAGLGDRACLAWRQLGAQIAAACTWATSASWASASRGPTTGGVQADLMRFGQLMANAGIPLQPTRMSTTASTPLTAGRRCSQRRT